MNASTSIVTTTPSRRVAHVSRPSAIARFGFATFALVAVPIVASAQSADVAPAVQSAPALASAAPTTAFVAAPAGPTLDAATAGPRISIASHRDAASHNVVMDPKGPHAGRSVALMVTGGAAVVLGLLVGGNAQPPLIVGGAVVGLLGLYQYLR